MTKRFHGSGCMLDVGGFSAISIYKKNKCDLPVVSAFNRPLTSFRMYTVQFCRYYSIMDNQRERKRYFFRCESINKMYEYIFIRYPLVE